jgi:flagella basal body P-ring formation protein FlgA
VVVLVSAMLSVALAVTPNQIEESLIAYALAECGAEAVDVLWSGIGHELAGGPDVELKWTGDPCRGRPELRLWLVEHQALQRRLPVRPGLAVWVRTPVAPERVLPGEDFETQSGLVRVQEIRGRPVEAGTWRSRVTLDPGQAVTTALVKPVPDVESGAEITLTVIHGNLRVHTLGRLTEAGYIGESVHVVNVASHVATRGLLVSPDTVLIH